MFSPARVAALLGAVAALLGAVAPAVANLNTHDTSGVIAGVSAVAVIVFKWLDGQAKHDARAHVVTRQAAVLPVIGTASTTGPVGTTLSYPTVFGPTVTGNTVAPGGSFSGSTSEPEAGDQFDGLPHLPTTDPTIVPPDSGDSKGV